MKIIVCFLLLLSPSLGLLSTAAAKDRQIHSQIQCSSKDFRYTFCRATVKGEVQLLKQLSQAPCRRGRTWGYDRRGIWVDQGCSGRFAIGGQRPGRQPGAGSSYGPSTVAEELVCASRNYRYHRCRVSINGRVRLTQQLSDVVCKRGRTWGYDNKGIWVDKGCSARFRIAQRPNDRQRSVRQLISCESRNFRYHYCQAPTRGGVRLAKQTSKAVCIEGRTWGYDRAGVWVDEGCAGRFEVGVEWYGK